MPRISLGVDAEVDVLSSEEHHDSISRLERLVRQGFEKDRSIRKTVAASGQFVADPLILDMGCAPPGALWVPLWITIVGPSDSAVVANSQSAIYLGGDTGGSRSLTSLLVPASAATAIPYWLSIGSIDSIYAHQGDHFYVLVHGAVAFGTSITAIGRVREVHPAAVEELNLL